MTEREGQEESTEAAHAWLVTRFRAIDNVAAEEVRNTLEGFRSAVAHEHGAGDYVIIADVDDPTSTWVLEEWATQADADRHEAAAGESDGADQLRALLAEPFAPVHARVIARTRAIGRGAR